MDARQQAATDMAYLRIAAREGGLPIDVKGGYALTPELRRLVQRGDIAVMRATRNSRRRRTTLHTTPTGIDRLAGMAERMGEDFGPETLIATLSQDRPRRR